MVVNGNIV